MVAVQGVLPFWSETSQGFAQLETDPRLIMIQRDRFVEYPTGRMILDRLERLLHGPQVQRPLCALIHGDSNSGKSALANKVQRDHPETVGAAGNSEFPVVRVSIPPYTDLGGFYDALIRAVGAPFNSARKPSAKWHEILEVYSSIRTRLILIDEVNNMMYGRSEHRQMILSSFKSLSNELEIPVVAFGTKEIVRAFHIDPQLANRFEPIGIPRCRLDQDYALFLQRFANSLGLGKESN